MNANAKRQKKYREERTEAGESRINVWLPEDDKERLQKLMNMLGYAGKGKKQQGYSQVISQALKMLEIELTPPEHRNLMRYGLLYMSNMDKTNE